LSVESKIESDKMLDTKIENQLYIDKWFKSYYEYCQSRKIKPVATALNGFSRNFVRPFLEGIGYTKRVCIGGTFRTVIEFNDGATLRTIAERVATMLGVSVEDLLI
jgi:phosphomannomutase